MSDYLQRSPSLNGIITALLVAVIVLVPLWSTTVPPMLDYPNHLARQSIILHFDDWEYLRQFYRVTWTASPYLATDTIVQFFAKFIGVESAGKAFLSLALLLIALGSITLSLALFGHISHFSLVALLFVHSTTVTLGFTSYLFGAGFAICLLALWIRFRDGPPWLLIAGFPTLSLILYFSHIMGFMVYGLTVSAYELGRYIQQIRSKTDKKQGLLHAVNTLDVVSLSLQLVLPTVLFLIFSDRGASDASMYTYGGFWRKIELLGTMFSYLMPPYNWSLDRLIAIGLSFGTLLLLIIRKAWIPHLMLWPLSAMVLLVIFMPMELSGGWGADHRLLLPLGLLWFGCISIRDREGKLSKVAYFALAALVAVRASAVTVEWRKANIEYKEYSRAFEVLDDGSRVYFAFGHSGKKQYWPRPVYALPHLALLKKQLYMPFLFAGPGFTLNYVSNDEHRELRSATTGPIFMDGKSPDWEKLLYSKYDFFFLVNDHFFETPMPKEFISIFKGEKINVYTKD